MRANVLLGVPISLGLCFVAWAPALSAQEAPKEAPANRFVEQPLGAIPQKPLETVLSPDGRHIAFVADEGRNHDVAVGISLLFARGPCREFAAEAEYQDAYSMADQAEEYGNRARDLARRRQHESGR